MNDLERFLAVCAGETPDYVPIFGFPGAPGMSRGCMNKTHDRLIETGMPPHVGGRHRLGKKAVDVESWKRYWGTTDPIQAEIKLARDAPGFRTTTRIEGEYEIIESESGAITRQVIDNDITYSMPEFIEYPVRDRDSWEFYKERMTPRRVLSVADVEDDCRRHYEQGSAAPQKGPLFPERRPRHPAVRDVRRHVPVHDAAARGVRQYRG